MGGAMGFVPQPTSTRLTPAHIEPFRITTPDISQVEMTLTVGGHDRQTMKTHSGSIDVAPYSRRIPLLYLDGIVEIKTRQFTVSPGNR
jgi:hypothetical protein